MATTANRADPLPRRPRILAIASGGGHWVQLLRLRPAFAGGHVAYVTVDPCCRNHVGNAPFYVVNDATRWNKFGLLRLALRIMWIVIRERPDVILTTGAAPGFFGIMAGRLIGARTAWIDSLANVDQLSMSGERARRWSTLWLTQWPQLARRNGPRFAGAVV